MASNKLKDNRKGSDINCNILQSNITVPNMQPMTIEPLIRLIRGQQVILDFDLASLYGIKIKRLKEQVNRNESSTLSTSCSSLLKKNLMRGYILCFHANKT